ncbi:MAG TPA: metalloregulator ArsR/SmtB family transcription factor [Vicinamibacterales bacterium]|nr:metalloregulator ArsR/SmtB family transcription factor [Vicinamibacterales bacterium]
MWSDLGVDLTPALYRLLGDQARLRLLRVLARERLNVTELTAVLGVAQSGVSRHLGLLKEAGLVAEERAGGFAYYRVAPRDGSAAADALWNLLDAHFAIVSAGPAGREDDARLHEVMRLRQENFEDHGGGEGRQLVPGRSWAAWARALGLLMPPLTVADLGCGEGYLTIEVARWARRVIAVDRSAAVLKSARALAARHGLRNITWRRGEIEAVPLPDGRVDLVLLSQALHHASDPALALAEAARVLAPGGKVLVLDLRRHDQHWVRDRLDDRWLGFEDRALGTAMRKAGFAEVRQQVGARRKGDPFTVIVASGTKPGAARAAKSQRP